MELYCGLYDDFAFKKFLEDRKNINLTKEQRNAGWRLVRAMEAYSPSGEELPHPTDMIADPEWEEVRNIAKNFLDTLESQVS